MTEILFAANDGTHGYELWVTDGTAAGTSLLIDINPGGVGSDPRLITNLGNGEALFQASDGANGFELWVTNGTAAGTSLVQDIYPGAGNSYPNQFVSLGNGKAVFSANDGTHGFAVWVTDGTGAGTSIIQTTNLVDPTSLGNGRAVFAAIDAGQTELWVTDGTAAGTSVVKPIAAPNYSSSPSDLTSLGNGRVLFSANDHLHGSTYQLWITDGTAGGTSLVGNTGSAATYDPKNITSLGNGTALFSANDGTHGYELWITNGTAGGTSLVADIAPGSDSSNANYFTSLGNGKTLFAASEGSHGTELWVTDGTAGGTSLLVDISAGSASSNPHNFASLGNGKAVFAATDGTHGSQLWVSDGSAAGTYMVKDINPGGDSFPQAITFVGNGEALFSANDGTQGYEMWVTNGTTAGTSLVRDIDPGSGSGLGLTTGFSVVAPPDFTVLTACYVAGTLIRTPSGEVPIEQLAVGDPVMTLSGESRPLTWIGTGRVRVTRGQRTAATPVIVRKGALADNVPYRDLHLTKGHSLYVNDALIPVEFLVNHRSIVWDDRAQEVTIYHLELATHDVLIANGAAAESYRDDGNRWLFQNANTGWTQPPQFPCSPVLTGGPLVEAIWRRLLDRSGPRPGVPLTDEPDLHLRVDGRRLDGLSDTGGAFMFRLRERPHRVHIVSRAGVLAELGLAPDARPLGVALRQIRLWRGARLHLVEASDPALRDGFHPFEADNDWLWTDGEAVLPTALFDDGPCDLELRVACTIRYPLFNETLAVQA